MTPIATVTAAPTGLRNSRSGVVMSAKDTIRFAVGTCTLGSVLVAASDKGICAVTLGDNANVLIAHLHSRFPGAEIAAGDSSFDRILANVIDLVDSPTAACNLPLDIRGTTFQQNVWAALRNIPIGTTASYADIAKRIGLPKAVRAVAQACGANRIAVIIPCHRVVRTDGSLSGYRWGVERKKALLERESLGARN